MWYNPSLQQLLFLETVLEEGTLVRAANRLHTTHSTISRGLKALCSGLGMNLFDKTPKGLTLNEIGKSLLRRSPQSPGPIAEGIRSGAVPDANGPLAIPRRSLTLHPRSDPATTKPFQPAWNRRATRCS